MAESLNNAFFITLLGMAVTFFALSLVAGSMYLLTRLTKSKADEDAEPADSAAPKAQEKVDIELPADATIYDAAAAAAAAAVAVAVAHELQEQRRAAKVWLRDEPRSLVSPWQLVARGQQAQKGQE